MLPNEILSKVPGYDSKSGIFRSRDPKFRDLVRDEVEDMVRMAQTTTPRFTGQKSENEKTLRISHGEIVEVFGREDPAADAKWEDHHPIARAIWEERGIKG